MSRSDPIAPQLRATQGAAPPRHARLFELLRHSHQAQAAATRVQTVGQTPGQARAAAQFCDHALKSFQPPQRPAPDPAPWRRLKFGS